MKRHSGGRTKTAAPPCGCHMVWVQGSRRPYSGLAVPVLWSSPWNFNSSSTRTHLRCNIKNEPNNNHLLWNGLALELCNSKFLLKIIVLNDENKFFFLMTNLEKAFKGTAWMECTVLEKLQSMYLKLKHGDRCGPTDVSLTSANEDKVLWNKRRKPSLRWPVVSSLYTSQDTVCWGLFHAHSASLGTA